MPLGSRPGSRRLGREDSAFVFTLHPPLPFKCFPRAGIALPIVLKRALAAPAAAAVAAAVRIAQAAVQ